MIDAVLATAVLAGLTLNTFLGWWWADPVAGYVILYYALRESSGIAYALNHLRLIPDPQSFAMVVNSTVTTLDLGGGYGQHG